MPKHRLTPKRKARARALLPQICAHCGTTDNLTLDHKLARALGGSNQQANLQMLCATCNSEKAKQEYVLATHPRRLRFEQLAQAVYGNKYGYSLAIHPEGLSSIKISCPLHGIFTRTPSQHLAGAGCPQCEAAVRKADRQQRHLNHLAWQQRRAASI